MKPDEVFCEATEGSLGRSLVCRGGKPVATLSVHCSKDKTLHCLFHKGRGPNANLPPGSWMINQGIGIMLGVSTGLCCWPTGHSAVTIAGFNLMTGHPSTYHLQTCYHEHFLWQTGQFVTGERGQLESTKLDHPIYLIINIILP